MKKIASIIITLAMILGLASGLLLLKPQKAQAFVFGDILTALKEFALDTLPRTVARHMMVRLQQEIARWAQGGFSDQNTPFAMTDWGQELKDAFQVATGKFIQEFHLTPLCAPIRVSLEGSLGLNALTSGQIPYTEYAACTLQNVVSNVEEFYKNPSISIYGWDTWNALTQPQNNILGSFLMAQQRQAELQDIQTQAKDKEIQAGGGIKNETICTQTDLEACQNACGKQGYCIVGNADFQVEFCDKCMNDCEKRTNGICLQEQVKKLGSEIKTSVDTAIGSDMQWLISADEITEMISLVFSGLFNKLVNGANGMLTKAFYKPTDTVAINQAQYGYYQQYQKSLTPQDVTKLRSEILASILKTVKSITTSTYDCNTDNQVTGDVFSEAAADIIDEESQHLYTTMEGVDLKPDYEVLDTSLAVNNGIAIYGETHDDIPVNKYPEKCAEIAGKNKKCKDIRTNFPYELNLGNVNPECTTGCVAQINTYRDQCGKDKDQCSSSCAADDTACRTACNNTYATCSNAARSRAVSDGKCSTQAVADLCWNGVVTIETTKTRCDDCMKKAQENCELQATTAEKNACIEQTCNNYSDILPSIKDPETFYQRCGQANLRNSCEVCLKEYFMPAYYCNEVNDFVYRAFVKYPALVYSGTWYGIWTKIGDGGGACSPNTGAYIPTGLICRIVPDFTFWGHGSCKTYCPNTTDDELKDISDDKPADLDCTGPNVNSEHSSWGGVFYGGGGHPTGLYVGWLTAKRTKCCAAFTGHMPEEYQRCRGMMGAQGQEQPQCYGCYPDTPQCCCREGYRRLAATRTGMPREGGLGGDCSNDTFNINDVTENKIYAYSNDNVNGDTGFVAYGDCSETDELCDNTAGVHINDDGQPCDTPTGVTDATGPAGSICSWDTNSSGPVSWQTCDLSGVAPGTNLHMGAYHDDNSDAGEGTGWVVCTKCDPNDSGYPYYGTNKDQCNNKIQ